MGRKTTIAGAGGLMAVAIALITPRIQQFEGNRSHVYKDIGGVLTVCSGHTGPDVVVSHVYSSDECTQLTNRDIDIAADGVLRTSPQLKDRPYQLAAAISFTYNLGAGAYAKSSVAQDFNAGNYPAGCKDMLKYVNAGGKFSQGLYNRRKQEYKICIGDLNVGIDPKPTS